MSLEDVIRKLNKIARKQELLSEELLEISGFLAEASDKLVRPPIVLFRVITPDELEDGK